MAQVFFSFIHRTTIYNLIKTSLEDGYLNFCLQRNIYLLLTFWQYKQIQAESLHQICLREMICKQVVCLLCLAGYKYWVMYNRRHDE